MKPDKIPTSPPPGMLAAGWIERGNDAFGRNDYDQARQAYEEAHALHVSQVSNYSLGLVAEAEAELEQAVTFYAAAVAADPLFIPARVNLGHLLKRAGRADDSFHHMLVAHALAPDHALTSYGLAEAALSIGRPDLAAAILPRLRAEPGAWALAERLEDRLGTGAAPSVQTPPDLTNVVDAMPLDLLETVAALDPADGATWTDFGNELLGRGRVSEALAIQLQAVQIDPLGLAPLNNLAVAARAAGRARDAVRPLLIALAQKPDWAIGWTNLGKAYQDIGAIEAAWDAWQLACRGDDTGIEALSALAETSRRLGRRDMALAVIDRIAALRPDDFMVPNNRGAYLLDLGQAEAALDCFREAARLNPLCALPLSNSGAASELLGRYQEARDFYHQALALGGEDPGLRARLVHVSQHLCNWSGFDEQCRKLGAALKTADAPTVQPFSLLAVPGIGPSDMRRAAERYARQYADITAVSPLQDAGRRPRIGYLSSDLYGHATAWLIAEILEQHDSKAFDIFVYSYGAAPEDETRQRLRAACPRFIDINALSDADAAAKIRADGIDVLVDLKGYTRGARPQILAFRPAPVQINYLGFPGTMGASFIDYIIADETIIPESLAGHYSEAVLRLPNCYQPNDRRRPLPPAPPRASVGLPEDALVLCSFNAAYKLTPDMFDIWCRLLDQVPDAVLWLLSSDPATNENLRHEASIRGIDPARLIFAPRTDLPSHLARFRCADLFLDSFPCTAHTTASDALWAGVPVVTRTGTTFASRVAASVVAAAGLPHLAAATADDYYELALKLATERDLLDECKAHLEQVRFTCPLFDSRAYTRDLEDLYRQVLTPRLELVQ